MPTNRIKGLRVFVIILLVLLVVQFEFGMATTLSDPKPITPFAFSIPAISDALNTVGFAAVFHATLGTLLTVFSLAALIMALGTKIRTVQVFGVLGFLGVALAATNGVLFTLSGFQEDGYSHGMATNFILTFGFYFLELYFLKPAGKTKTG